MAGGREGLEVPSTYRYTSVGDSHRHAIKEKLILYFRTLDGDAAVSKLQHAFVIESRPVLFVE